MLWCRSRIPGGLETRNQVPACHAAPAVLARSFVLALLCSLSVPNSSYADAIKVAPFFNAAKAPALEKICDVFKRQALKCEPSVNLYFLIDNMPGKAFTVQNDSALTISDLHLQIFDPGKYQFTVAGNGAVTFTPNANGNFTQPDAIWTDPKSDIFGDIKLSNNNRTVDFTLKAGQKGIAPGDFFIDGKDYTLPANTRIMVISSFSTPEPATVFLVGAAALVLVGVRKVRF